MEPNIKAFSNQIEQQFPAIYRKDGETLIKFVEAYYEWMEQTGNITNQSMSIMEYMDIDTTIDDFLGHFRDTYMVGLPSDVIGNQRLLQKHILDLYRSKNSKTSLELLFRLLYNTGIEIYIPSTDILRASDGKYERRKYLEVQYTTNFHNFLGKQIRGIASGAIATVAATERRIIKGKMRYLMYVEDVRGTFQISENLYYNEARDHPPARCIGSIFEVDVDISVAGWTVGEEVYIDETMSPTLGEGFTGYVSEVYNSDTGMIFPVVVDGGTGYSLGSIVTLVDNENTQGSDAAFAVGSLKDTSMFAVSEYSVEDMMGIPIDAPDYRVYGIGVGIDPGFTPNFEAAMDITMEYENIEIGTITAMRILNPGKDYDGKVSITVVEPRIVRLNRDDILGDDAIIDNYAAFGEDLASKIMVRDSGVGYQGGPDMIYFKDAANIKFTGGNFDYASIGKSRGRYVSTDGFPSGTSRLQDSYYYQEYSYEIRAAQSLRQYGDIVKAICHPSGNELFGSVKVSNDSVVQVIPSTLITID